MSQPGVRGRLSEAPDDFLTPRYPAAPPDGDPDQRPALYGKPGQQLVWPGQFLLGEPRQDTENLLDRVASPDPPTYPEWARRGSYLVCRRLRQDVAGFWNFAAAAAAGTGTTPSTLASMMVGRWPSGAPLMRAPKATIPPLAGDEFANNNFLFDDDTRPLPLRPGATYRRQLPAGRGRHARQGVSALRAHPQDPPARHRHRAGQAARQHAADDPAPRDRLR